MNEMLRKTMVMRIVWQYGNRKEVGIGESKTYKVGKINFIVEAKEAPKAKENPSEILLKLMEKEALNRLSKPF